MRSLVFALDLDQVRLSRDGRIARGCAAARSRRFADSDSRETDLIQVYICLKMSDFQTPPKQETKHVTLKLEMSVHVKANLHSGKFVFVLRALGWN